ncbi:MAG TPA: hypothetical protein VGM66_14610 [Candidatus Udaeobacter sp.]
MNRNTWVIFRTIVWIGLVAGSLDITENLVFDQFRGITPWRVFQYIASGLIGPQAFQRGWASVAVGIALHYAIALIWTGIFYAVACKSATVRRRPVLSGLLYGGIVYLVMNFIVVPLSGVPQPQRPLTLVSRINAAVALLVCIGLTMSLLMRRTLFQGRN